MPTKTDYLATGFADVDSAGEGAFLRCLELLDSLPYFRQYKEETYRRLELRPGLSVLDVGCGLGDDCARISARVSPGGAVTGLDTSRSMIASAVRRWPGRANLTFAIGDARMLPFASGSFDRVRIDRSLQHIARPATAVAELYRVLAPGGLALVYDNDWGTFSVSSERLPITRRLQEMWCYSFTNPWIGRHLGLLFKQAGFEELSVLPRVSVITDFATADRVYDLQKTLERLTASAEITQDEADDWRDELLRQTSDGVFQTSLTAYMVVGRKPTAPHRPEQRGA